MENATAHDGYDALRNELVMAEQAVELRDRGAAQIQLTNAKEEAEGTGNLDVVEALEDALDWLDSGDWPEVEKFIGQAASLVD